MWFNSQAMTVRKMTNLTNLKSHKVNSLRARFSEPELNEMQETMKATRTNIIGSPKHYSHKSDTLNLKTILNNMREVRIGKLKQEIALENEKED